MGWKTPGNNCQKRLWLFWLKVALSTQKRQPFFTFGPQPKVSGTNGIVKEENHSQSCSRHFKFYFAFRAKLLTIISCKLLPPMLVLLALVSFTAFRDGKKKPRSVWLVFYLDFIFLEFCKADKNTEVHTEQFIWISAKPLINLCVMSFCISKSSSFLNRRIRSPLKHILHLGEVL